MSPLYAQEFEYEADAYAPRMVKAFYLSFASFLSKQLNVLALSAPAKIGALGYQFFILLMLAFYTASLTSILVSPVLQYLLSSYLVVTTEIVCPRSIKMEAEQSIPSMMPLRLIIASVSHQRCP